MIRSSRSSLRSSPAVAVFDRGAHAVGLRWHGGGGGRRHRWRRGKGGAGGSAVRAAAAARRRHRQAARRATGGADGGPAAGGTRRHRRRHGGTADRRHAAPAAPRADRRHRHRRHGRRHCAARRSPARHGGRHRRHRRRHRRHGAAPAPPAPAARGRPAAAAPAARRRPAPTARAVRSPALAAPAARQRRLRERHLCDCAADSACQTAYGTGYICLGTGTGDCVRGPATNNGDCGGKICGSGHNCCAHCTATPAAPPPTAPATSARRRHLRPGELPLQRRLRHRPDLQRQLALRRLRHQRLRLRDRLRQRLHLRLRRLRDGQLPHGRRVPDGQVCNASHACAAAAPTTGMLGQPARICGTASAPACIGNCHDQQQLQQRPDLRQQHLRDCTRGHPVRQRPGLSRRAAARRATAATRADCTTRPGLHRQQLRAPAPTTAGCTSRLRRGPRLQRRAPAWRATAARRATARDRHDLRRRTTLICGACTGATRTQPAPTEYGARPHLQRRRLRHRQLPQQHGLQHRPGLRPHAHHACGSGNRRRHDLPGRRRELRLELHLPGERLHRRQLPRRRPTATTRRRSATASPAARAARPPTAPTPTARTTSARAAPASRATATAPPSAATTSCASATPAWPAPPAPPATPSAWATPSTARCTSASGSASAWRATATTRPASARAPARSAASPRPHTCGGCGSGRGDTACKADTTYGSDDICLTGALRPGRLPRHLHRLHRRQDLRRLDRAHLRKLRRGQRGRHPVHERRALRRGDICYQGLCGAGNCHATSSDCTGGQRRPHLRRQHRRTPAAAAPATPVQDRLVLRQRPTSATRPPAPTGQVRERAPAPPNSAACTANGERLLLRRQLRDGQLLHRHRLRRRSAPPASTTPARPATRSAATSGTSIRSTATTTPRPAATCRAATRRRAAPSRPSTRAINVIGTVAVRRHQDRSSSASGTTRRGLAAGETCRSPCRPTPRSRRRAGRSRSCCRLRPARPTRPTLGLQPPNNGSAIAGDPAAPLILDGNNHTAASPSWSRRAPRPRRASPT